MANEIPTIPTRTENLSDEERVEGVVEDQEDILRLDLTDNEVAQMIGNLVDDDKSWWNKELDLDDVRKKAEKYYLNESYDPDDLYEFQVPYKNNRIIVDVESLVPMAVSSPAEPLVTEANDTDASRQLAMDLGGVLMQLYDDMYLKAKLTKVVRHLLMGKRIGILKYWFDPTLGKITPDGDRKGAIVVETVRPEKVVFARETDPGKNPVRIAHYLTDTVEVLINKFPSKKDDIFKHLGIKRGTKKQLQKPVGYIEVWFNYIDKGGKITEAVAWKLNDIVLDKIKNPNWNYDEFTQDEQGQYQRLNFLDAPEKPFILFTHLDIDKYLLDETALIDHAMPLQDVLNKRGRQVVENSDQAGAGTIYNTQMISQDDMAQVIGDPSEKLGVNGDVRAAATRLPYNALPNYVLEDKYDARAEIDNIFGANAPIKGEESGIKTLGQEIISQRANIGRLQPLADSLEDGMDRLYKALVQMMKVYWDEPEMMRITKSEGKTQFINWSSDKIEDGVKVQVKAGSALPKDKFALRNETIQALAILDPLSIAEGLDKNNPKEFARRIVLYRFFMDRYLTEVLDDSEGGADQQAMADIQLLLKGEMPPVPDDVTKEYLSTLQQFVESQQFQQLEETIKQNVLQFMEMVTSQVKGDIGETEEETTQIEEGGEVPMEMGEQPEQTGNRISNAVLGLRERLGI